MNGGYRVSCCSNGREVMERVGQIRPDMILLDVMMPDMDGPATFAELRRRADCRDIPVVFVTASVRAQDTQGYLGLGANGVMAKPFDPATVCSEIEVIWRATEEKRARESGK
jgi:CheY-like chemotaxis protein